MIPYVPFSPDGPYTERLTESFSFVPALRFFILILTLSLAPSPPHRPARAPFLPPSVPPSSMSSMRPYAPLQPSSHYPTGDEDDVGGSNR